MDEPGADGSAGRQGRTSIKWTAEMEEAYEAALARAGGLEVAKPKAVWENMCGSWPDITLQNVKWHLLAHRRREERHREQGPPESAALKWTGRLESAYEAAVAQLGGLHAARPKQLLQLLQPEFPDLQLQNLKWHLQKQRTKAVQGRAQQSGGSQPDDSREEEAQRRRQQQQGGSSRRRLASDGDSAPPAVAAADPQPALRSSGSSATLRHAVPGGLPAAPAHQQQQQQQPPRLPAPQQPQVTAHQAAARRLLVPASAQPSGSAPSQQLPASLVSQLEALSSQGPSPAPDAAALERLLSAAHKRQQVQRPAAAAAQGWQAAPRLQLLPWEPYLLPEAHRRLGYLARTILCYRQVVAHLHQRAAQLQQLIGQLERVQEAAAAFEAAAAGGGVPSSAGTAPGSMESGGSLALDVQRLAQELLMGSAGGGGGGAAGAGVPAVPGGAASWGGMGGRSSRTQAAVASAFAVVREGGAAAAAAAAAQQEQMQEQGALDHLATCRVAGCRQCAMLRRMHPEALLDALWGHDEQQRQK